MRIKELQDMIIERLGLNLTNRMVQRRTDEFLPNIVRAENDNSREYTDEQAKDMVLICSLLAIGVSDDDVKGILDNTKDVNTIISSYLSMCKVCNYVSELFVQDKEVANEN